jgi:hypothetical protein
MKNSVAVKLCWIAVIILSISAFVKGDRPRVIVTTDGEEDDRCSMVRFLLYANEFDVEGIINSSSVFHWKGGTGWNAFHPVTWIKDYIQHYSEVYENLLLHDSNYPTPSYLLSRWKVGNIDGIGEMTQRTDGAVHIANVLLDASDSRPVWLQAWGGSNTIADAQIIQEDHPDRMAEVAAKMRLYLIWEQDGTYRATSVRTGNASISDHHCRQFELYGLYLVEGAAEPPKRYFNQVLWQTL